MTRWLFPWLALLLFALLPVRAEDPLFHGQIEWARLKTSSATWSRHMRGDPRFLEFIREATNLDIDPNWHVADVENLRQMTAYPFIFSEGIQTVADEKGRNNLHEYFLRNGFIFIDSCINTHVNPDPDAFLQMQIDTLKAILPESRVERMPADGVIFHSCFTLKDGLPHTYMDNIPNPQWGKHGLYAVYNEKRLVSLISLSGLQCGWDGMNPDREHISNCMKMMVNIYFYVLNQ